MSTTPEPDLDLEQLFLPAWAKQSPDLNRYARFEGEPAGRAERGFQDRDRRGPRRDRPPRQDRGAGGRPSGPMRGERRSDSRGERGRAEPQRDLEPLPQVDALIEPEEKGVESLARQIKLTGRAYPLFEIALLVLKKSDRFQIRFRVVKKPDGQIAQPLFFCSLDETLWMSEAEAAEHVLRKHFDTFYQTDKIAIEPPKGTYTFVAQCGMSGVVLGPPNYHDYQAKLRKLHAERFSRMPFEVFKARVRIVKDEAVVKQWLEAQSWKTEYVALNVPESVKLPTRETVEKHFRETHLANLVRAVETHGVNGAALAGLPTGLRRLAYGTLDEQRRFPLKVVHVLSHQFARHGLQFFKVNKSVTYVAVARPHYLDMTATPVSDGVKRIIGFINATPRCTRRQLLAALAPPPADAAAAAPTAPPASSASPGPPAAAPAVETPPPASPAAAEASPEATAINADLHWLVHEGHVIEFANGVLETAKQLAPRPSKPLPAKSPPTLTEPAHPPGAPAPATEPPATAAREAAPEPAPDPPTDPVATDGGDASAAVSTEAKGPASAEPVSDAL